MLWKSPPAALWEAGTPQVLQGELTAALHTLSGAFYSFQPSPASVIPVESLICCFGLYPFLQALGHPGEGRGEISTGKFRAHPALGSFMVFILYSHTRDKSLMVLQPLFSYKMTELLLSKSGKFFLNLKLGSFFLSLQNLRHSDQPAEGAWKAQVLPHA